MLTPEELQQIRERCDIHHGDAFYVRDMSTIDALLDTIAVYKQALELATNDAYFLYERLKYSVADTPTSAYWLEKAKE